MITLIPPLQISLFRRTLIIRSTISATPIQLFDQNNEGYLRRGAAGDGIKAWSSGSHFWVRSVMQVTMFLAGLAVLWLFLYNSISSFEFPTSSYYFNAESLSVYIYIYIYIYIFVCLCECVPSCLLQLEFLVVKIEENERSEFWGFGL